jgi:hypothetical protein
VGAVGAFTPAGAPPTAKPHTALAMRLE